MGGVGRFFRNAGVALSLAALVSGCRVSFFGMEPRIKPEHSFPIVDEVEREEDFPLAEEDIPLLPLPQEVKIMDVLRPLTAVLLGQYINKKSTTANRDLGNVLKRLGISEGVYSLIGEKVPQKLNDFFRQHGVGQLRKVVLDSGKISWELSITEEKKIKIQLSEEVEVSYRVCRHVLIPSRPQFEIMKHARNIPRKDKILTALTHTDEGGTTCYYPIIAKGLLKTVYDGFGKQHKHLEAIIEGKKEAPDYLTLSRVLRYRGMRKNFHSSKSFEEFLEKVEENLNHHVLVKTASYRYDTSVLGRDMPKWAKHHREIRSNLYTIINASIPHETYGLLTAMFARKSQLQKVGMKEDILLAADIAKETMQLLYDEAKKNASSYPSITLQNKYNDNVLNLLNAIIHATPGDARKLGRATFENKYGKDVKQWYKQEDLKRNFF